MGSTDIRPSVSQQPLMLTLSFAPQLLTSSASTLTRSSMPICQAGYKGTLVTCQRVSVRQCYIGDGSFNGKGRFSRVRRLKNAWPINTKFQTNDYRPNAILKTNFHNIRPKRLFCPIWWSCTISVTQVSFFSLLVTSRPPERAGRFAKLMPQTTSFATRKCLLGVSTMKIFFSGGVPLPRNFQRAFYVQIENVE
jgi:hypothetical protein